MSQARREKKVEPSPEAARTLETSTNTEHPMVRPPSETEAPALEAKSLIEGRKISLPFRVESRVAQALVAAIKDRG